MKGQMKGQLSLFREWQYDEDNASMMCRCPECGGRLLIGAYSYCNRYNYCPYCGVALLQGAIGAAGKRIYGWDDEVVKKGEIFKRTGHWPD